MKKGKRGWYKGRGERDCRAAAGDRDGLVVVMG